MTPQRITVFLPCHTLGDFPTWLDEAEADDLLAAWTAAWDPRLVALAGKMPEWASVDLPPRDPAGTLGIVPAFTDERFASQVDSLALDGSAWVRGVTGREALVAAALAEVAGPEPCAAPVLAADFHALGLAWLLAELLARRMRSHTNLEASGFAEAVVAAARSAVAGDEAAARERLRECYGALEASRSHYYPVDVWLLDLVLLAETTLGAALDAELDSPVPLAVIATGQVVEALAARNPAALMRLRGRHEAATLECVGGRHDARPLDLCTPAEILASLDRGMQAWRDHVGTAPTTFAQITGGSVAILPRLLGERGYRGVIWNLFDGTALPDASAGRIAWEGGGGTIDGVARLPVDARSAGAILMLADRIGDAMDHDHAAIVQFAHYPGTASRWFADLRRIASWSKLLGAFVTPDELLRRTAEAAVVVSFEPDSFPVTLPVASRGIRDQVAEQVTLATQAAAALAAERPRAAVDTPRAAAGPPRRPAGFWATVSRRLFAAGDDERLVLDNGLIRARVHEATGGLLSVRCPGDRGNRVSQRLALRTTRPAPAAGQPWESVEERAEYSGMVADAVARHGDVIESRGRLTDARGVTVGTFVQRVALAASRPLVLLEMEVRLAQPLVGPALESYAACRFAWHENEMPDIHRSLNLESIPTERWRFTAPHFVEIRTEPGRHEVPPTALFTCGLPWHVRTSEHTLDAVLPADDREPIVCRMAIGASGEPAADVALEVMAHPSSLAAGLVRAEGDTVSA